MNSEVWHVTNACSRQPAFQCHSLLNPTNCVAQEKSDDEPVQSSKERRQNEGSQVDPLMPVVPQVGPGVGQAGEQADLAFDLERQGYGRRIKDKEKKIGEDRLAFGIDMTVEKHEERSKRMDHEQRCPQH